MGRRHFVVTTSPRVDKAAATGDAAFTDAVATGDAVRLGDRPEGNPYLAGCPTRHILDRIGDRWTVLVVGVLSEGTARFSELRRRIDGISQKMLTQTLRELERDGLVTRTVHAEVPVRVEYSLTAAGRSLTGPLKALEDWSVEHLGAVLTARQAYDGDRAA
jgi:DNA-binding HxlR family transcriptional regulator